jgi:hypothetical protein
MARRPEESARAILRIIVSGGTKADEIVLYGILEKAFLEADPNSLAPEFVEGLKYAEGHGWLTIIEGTQIRLTNLGYEGGIGTSRSPRPCSRRPFFFIIPAPRRSEQLKKAASLRTELPNNTQEKQMARGVWVVT